MTRAAAVVAVAVAIAVGCGGRATGDAQPAALAATWRPPAILANVPADTPYMFGVIEPLSQEIRDRFFATADQKIAEYVEVLGDASLDRASLPPSSRAMLAVIDELRGKDLRHWFRELGFDPRGRFVVYGLSVWPVVRVGVADPDKVRRILKKVIAASELRLDEGSLQGRRYWRLTEKKVTIIAAILDDELVASAFPTAISEHMVPLVLGVQKPRRSLRDTNELANLIGHYGLLTAMVGYVDVRAAAAIVTQRTASAEAALDKPLAEATGPVSAACRADIDRLVSLVPRVVLGYKKLDKHGMHARIVVETPAAVTAAIGRLRVPIPEVTAGLSGHPLGSFGVAAKLDEALPLLRNFVRQIDRNPFACAWFSSINEAVAMVLPQLERPLPPALHGLRGVSFVLDSVELEPLTLSAHALVVGAHAREALELLFANAPGMGSVRVPADGTSVALPLAMYGVPASVTAHAAATADRAGIAVGTASVTRATEILQARTPARSPLMTLGMDGIRLRELGWLDEKDQSSITQMRDLSLQLDVLPEGLVLEMYATFAQ